MNTEKMNKLHSRINNLVRKYNGYRARLNELKQDSVPYAGAKKKADMLEMRIKLLMFHSHNH
jgi:hypothetical protein